MGCAVSADVLNGLFHRAAAELMPIYQRLRALLPFKGYINADETPQPVLAPNKTRRGFMWTFVADDFVVYDFSPTRSGETPKRLLEGSAGILQVDGYSGYNAVTAPDSRSRAGCMSHCRRKFLEAETTAPELAGQAIEVFHRLYLIERQAKAEGIVGTPEHLELRQRQAKPIAEEFHQWLTRHKDSERPKSPIGAAIRYALNQWKALSLYLDHPQVSIDNNIAELRLRIIALGRKSSLFVGSNEGGQNLAALMSLVTTAHVNGLNPAAYIADLLLRVHDPTVDLDELLPHRWKQPPQPPELEAVA